VVRNRIFSKEANYGSILGGYDFINSYLVPTLPQSKDSNDVKVKKIPLEQKLKKLASLKKHPLPCTFTTKEFVIKYGLPKHGKNPYKLRILQNLIERDINDVFRPVKGRNRRSRYLYVECKYMKKSFIICYVFFTYILMRSAKVQGNSKAIFRGIIMEK